MRGVPVGVAAVRLGQDRLQRGGDVELRAHVQRLVDLRRRGHGPAGALQQRTDVIGRQVLPGQPGGLQHDRGSGRDLGRRRRSASAEDLRHRLRGLALVLEGGNAVTGRRDVHARAES
ncbi:hypothetical protein O1M63_46165 [Streptomyces mirabilis]|nr:hypothetical protein [Streptomyces mirabilis]